MLMLDENSSITNIAKKIGRHRSSVSREIRRNKKSRHVYCATAAAKSYRKRRKQSVRPLKIQVGSSLYIELKFWLTNNKWSPEQMSAMLKETYPDQSDRHVSPETIYAHIYAQPKGALKKLMVQSLRRHKSKRDPRGSKDSQYGSVKVATKQLIANRPDDITERKIAGHWEGDLIVGPMNQSCVGTLVERKTGFLILSKMKSKSAKDVRIGFTENMQHLPEFLRYSLTYDRGSEMAEHPILARDLKFSVYFADPHSPWQRGSNENTNGLIRQFLPKGHNLSAYSQSDLDYIAWLLNTRPRERHGFKTPLHMMEKEEANGLMNVALDS
jgi:IS30 family transposase